jgi:hypothetical protein
MAKLNLRRTYFNFFQFTLLWMKSEIEETRELDLMILKVLIKGSSTRYPLEEWQWSTTEATTEE